MLLVASVAALATGAVAALTGHAALADAVWGATTAVGAVGASIMLWRTLHAGHLGVDVVAVLAMVGSLVAGEQLAGALIAVMLATGRTLEARAARRAQKELTALIERAPHVAHRVAGDGSVADVAVDDVAPGDVLVVKPGDVVPVDGVLAQDAAVIDESTLTGEALPVERAGGDPVRSGSVNAGGALTMVASTAPRTAPTPGSCAWCRTRRRRARRSSGSPTGTRRCSSSRHWSPRRWRGWCPVSSSARWPCS